MEENINKLQDESIPKYTTVYRGIPQKKKKKQRREEAPLEIIARLIEKKKNPTLAESLLRWVTLGIIAVVAYFFFKALIGMVF